MAVDEAHEHRSDERRPGLLADVSNAMVRVFKEQFGRGPTTARTFWAGPDTLVCVLEDTLTQAERRLVDMGEHQRLRESRVFFQYASVAEFCGPVERITGRTVRAFHSSVDSQVDGHSVEVFVLHPEGGEGPSRTTLEQ